MGTLTDDVTATSSQLALKSLEISAEFVKAFMEHLFTARTRHLEAAVKEYQYKMITDHKQTEDAKKVIQEGKGLINAKTLYRSKEPLTAGTITLDKMQQKEFAKLSKRFGLTYALVKNDYEPDNKLLVFAQKDLVKVKDITEQMTVNAKVIEIDKRIEQIQKKGTENYTKQDFQDLSAFEDLREGITNEWVDNFNKEGNEAVFAKMSNEQEQFSRTFDAALNHQATRDYVSDEPSYVVDRQDPTKYIELNTSRVDFDGQQHTKTHYSVFKDNEIVHTCDDSPSEGKTANDWFALRDTMKQTGDFSDDVIIFSNKAEFEAYIRAFGEHVNSDNSLQQALYVRGATFDEKTGNVLVISSDGQMDTALNRLKAPDLSDVDKVKFSEAVVIGDQIKLNRNLEFYEKENARIDYLMRGKELGKPEYNKLVATKRGIDDALTEHKKLATDRMALRKTLGSVGASNAVEKTVKLARVRTAKTNETVARADQNVGIASKVNDLSKINWRASLTGNATQNIAKQVKHVRHER
jgi:hypothetical protein